MNTSYIEYIFKVSSKDSAVEILIAELGALGFESFVETEEGVTAYIQKKDWHSTILNEVFILNSGEFEITFSYKEIEQTNWNIEWEKNFNPIQVDEKVSVRAPFHENPNLEYDIVIEPKMSFGTGHHETTHMMIQQMLQMDLKNKKLLDMGCGTGILAIFSEMKGAKPIDAIDIDEWCYKNSLENIDRNKSKSITVYQGDVELIATSKSYDIILANINRNILLADMKQYANSLNKNGLLLLSGFYKSDIPIIDKEASNNGLKLVNTIERNKWVSLQYQK